MSQHLTRVIFLRFLPALLALALTARCYEDAVAEKILLDFRADGRVLIQATVDLLPPSEFHSRPLRQRVDAFAAEFEDERDAWSRRFRSVILEQESRTWEKELRKLVRMEHSGLTQQRELPQFFADSSLTISVLDGDSWRELAIFPGISSRASNQQRAQVNAKLDQWSATLSAYFAALARLYRYADAHPERARAVIGFTMDEFLTDEVRRSLGELDDDETLLVDEVRAQMEKVSEALVASDREAYSLDELSSLAFDPLPAEFTIQTSGPILEVEGAEKVSEKSARIPPRRIWESLESLRAEWITPDPLVTWVNAARIEQEPINLDRFLEQERRVNQVPAANTIRAAIERRLASPAFYRIRWQR